MTNIYIAHPIALRAFVKEQCFRLQELGIHTINPFYECDGSYRDNRPEIKQIDEGKIQPYNIVNTNTAENIMDSDLLLIQRADALLAFLPEASVGTSMEIFYAGYILHKPVYVITKDFYNHAWISCLSKRFKSIEVFMKWWNEHEKV